MKKVLSFLLFSVFCLILPACGDDKEEEIVTNSSIIGSWKLISTDDPDYWEDAQFDFYTDGYLDVDFNHGQEIVACKYRIRGNVLHIDFAVRPDGSCDDIMEGVYEINGNIMTYNSRTWDAEDPDDVYVDRLVLKRK